MAVFGGLVLTNAGRNLYAKAQTGKLLKFKRIAIGDGELGITESMINLTRLKHEVLSCEIYSMKVFDSTIAKTTFILKNESLDVGFYWREIGIIAEDPDTKEEILYCYGNARENGEYIAAKGGADILEKKVSIDIIVENVSNVSAIINESMVLISKDEFDKTIQDLDSKKANINEILEHKFHLDIIETIEDNSQITIPCNYKVRF